jgi:hypothetical protein
MDTELVLRSAISIGALLGYRPGTYIPRLWSILTVPPTPCRNMVL